MSDVTNYERVNFVDRLTQLQREVEQLRARENEARELLSHVSISTSTGNAMLGAPTWSDWWNRRDNWIKGGGSETKTLAGEG